GGRRSTLTVPVTVHVLPYFQLTLSEPEDGLVTNRDAVQVSGTVSDPAGVAALTVNGQPVPVDGDGRFTARIPLDEGENVITVTARSISGVETTVQRTVTADWTAPVLADLEPAGDVTLEWGGSLVLRFRSEPGLEASYQVVLEGQAGSWEAGDLALPGMPMEEVEPGVYRAEFTAPGGARFSGAAVRFYARDEAGNVVLVTAPGRITVVEPGAGGGSGDPVLPGVRGGPGVPGGRRVPPAPPMDGRSLR